ncbi:hypothetical protein BGX23_008001 [Mortierella sp. AD031]|nr:hypothetical protein BGX23_008001 [Mortierella sp. AD031]KAG0210496.1 hypothetical protein BGX33_004849 [Mortierella sp. NVP41]
MNCHNIVSSLFPKDKMTWMTMVSASKYGRVNFTAQWRFNIVKRVLNKMQSTNNNRIASITSVNGQSNNGHSNILQHQQWQQQQRQWQQYPSNGN